jgi:WS/DGAT/MGAT family acyltransferase
MAGLATLEAGLLPAGHADHESLAVGGLAVMEGPAPGHESIVSMLTQRVRTYPRLTQRLRSHAFGLSAPEWTSDPGFNLADHVRRIALPRPGDEEALRRATADLVAMRLDLDRPPWEAWVIEGLTDNRWAMLIKVHHAMADGIAVSRIFEGLCDDGVSYSLQHRISAAQEHTDRRSLPRVGISPLKLASALWNVSATIAATAAVVARGAAELAIDLVLPTSPSALDGPVSNLCRYSTARVPMHDIAEVCRRFDVTVNDVVLAALTESYRALMIDRGESPRRAPQHTPLAVSMRSAQAPRSSDDRGSLMRLPVEEKNPLRRLKTVHSRLNDTKSPPDRLAFRLPHHGVATTVTNVTGPRQQLHLMGRTVLGLFPIVPGANLRTGVAVLSYADDLFFGVVTDYEKTSEADTLARSIELAVERLTSCSKHPSGRKDHCALTALGTG